MFVSLVKLIDTHIQMKGFLKRAISKNVRQPCQADRHTHTEERFVEKGQSRLNVRHVVLSGCSIQRHREYRFVERAASQRPSVSIIRLIDTERGGRFV